MIHPLILSTGNGTWNGDYYGHPFTLQFSSIQSHCEVTIPSACTIQSMRWAPRDVLPWGSMTATLYKNGVATSLACVMTTATGLATVVSTNAVTLAAGDKVYIRLVRGGGVNPTTTFDMELEIEGGGTNESFYGSGSTASNTMGTPASYAGVFANGPTNMGAGTETVALAGTITGFGAGTENAPGVGKTHTFTFYKNGVKQDGTGGTVNTVTTISDLNNSGYATFSLPVSVGDTLRLEVSGTGGPAGGKHAGVVVFSASSGNTWVMAGRSPTSIHVGLPPPRYNSVERYLTPTSSDTQNVRPLNTAFNITAMRWNAFQSPGGSATWVMTLRKNAVDTGLAGTITHPTASSGLVSSTVAVAVDDLLSQKIDVGSGTPADTLSHIWVFVVGIAPANTPPVADAGPDDDSGGLLTYTLAGSGTDADLDSLTYAWSQVSGPGTAVFDDATDPESGVTVDVPGVYVFELEVSDGTDTDTDTVSIDFNGFTYLWEKISGPGTVTFTDPTSLCAGDTAAFSEDGTYVLRLTVFDGVTTAYDERTVTVEPIPGYVVIIDEVITEFLVETLSIQAAANSRDTLEVQTQSDDITQVVPRNAEIVLELEGERVFGGILNNPHYRGFGGIGWAEINTKIEAIDFNAYADRRVVTTNLPVSSHADQLVSLSESSATNPAQVGTVGDHNFTTGQNIIIEEHLKLNIANINAYAFLGFTTNVSDGDTVTVGATTYTFNTVLGGANSVLIGAGAIDSKNNLVAAINLEAGIGTLYGTGTVINASATAGIPAELGGGDNDDEVVVLTHKLAGTGGNGTVVGETGAVMTMFHEGAIATLEMKGGVDAVSGGGGLSLLNGDHVATVVDSWHFTVPFNNLVVGYGGYARAAYTLKEILEDVIAYYLDEYDITLDPAQLDGPAIAGITVPWKTLTEVLNDITALTGWLWEIDYFKVLRMWEPGDIPAAFDITEDDGHILGDLEVEYTEDYANSIVFLAGGDGPGDVVNTQVVADGIAPTGAYKQYEFPYNAMDAIDAGTWNVLVLDNVVAGVVRWGMPDATFSWGFDYRTHSLYHDESVDGPVAAGTIISTSYQSRYPIVVLVEDAGEITANRRYDKLVRNNDIKNIDVARATAANELQNAIDEPRTVHYTTTTPGLHPGQVQHITSAKRGLDADFLITEVNTVNEESNAVRYKITTVEGTRFRGTWRDIYKNWNR